MKYYFLFIFFFIGFALKSQDIFMLFNGNEINAKLLTIDATKISYSEKDSTKSIDKTEVFRITLQNGEKILIKPETVYPPIVYDDIIIFTDGSDLKVKILSIENESVKYIFENKETMIHANLVQFIKYKDGKTIKGSDLIKFEDKVILNNGEELNNVKYKEKNTTHFIIQEKGKLNSTELLFTDVFVVKLANGEKKFPPKIEEKKAQVKIELETPEVTNANKDSVITNNERKDLVKIDELSIDNKTTNLPKTKYDKIKLKDGQTIKGHFISFTNNNLNYKNEDGELVGILISKVSYILDENEEEIQLPVNNQNKKNISNKKNKEDYRNFSLSLSHQELFGSVKLNSKFGIGAFGSYSIDFGFRYHNNIETNIEPIYSRFSAIFSDGGDDIQFLKEQLGIGIINRIYLTKRFNFQLGLNINRDISLKARVKFAGDSYYSDWVNTNSADLSSRFHLGIQPGFGWKGRRAAFDFIFQNLDLKGDKTISEANSNLYGFRLEILLFNSNKLNN
jgi:hypothetical protein